MGGLMSVTGLPGQGPIRAGIPIADLSAGLYCAFGILVALLEREASGEGQWVKSSLLQAQVAMLDFQAARWLVQGEVPGQAGNDHPTSIPTGLFATRDGYINIAASGQTIWRRFCAAIGATELVDRPDYGSAAARSQNRASLNSEIAAILRGRRSVEWIDILNRAGVPCGPVNRIDEVFADPQIRHLGIAQEVEHSRLGRIQLVGQPIELSRTPSRLGTAAPERGEHTDSLLSEFGFDGEAVSELRRRGVI
jgi:formyl-CoA transferase